MMEFQFPPINYWYLAAALITAGLAALSWGRAVNISGRFWVGVLLSSSVWTAGELVANLGTTLHWQLGFQRLVYLGVIGTVTFWLFFSLYYSGNERWLTRRRIAVLLVVPIISLLMVSTLEWHSLLYTGAQLDLREGFHVFNADYGAGFWLLVLACAYPYILVGSCLLLRFSLQRPGLYRSQSVLLAIAALMPVVPNMFYLSGWELVGGFDPTSLFFVLSAILISVATQRYRFLSLTPIARDRVFETMGVAVAVCNRDYVIIDVNPAFARLMREDPEAVIGEPLESVLDRRCHGQGLETDPDSGGRQGRVEMLSDERQFDINSKVIGSRNEDTAGYLVLFHDVTRVQKALDRIEHLANTDSLTALPYTRTMSDGDEGNGGVATGDVVVIGDIDHFGRINEQHGHEFGDRVLTLLSRLMSRTLRLDDSITRWGGEQFCIVLRGISVSTGREIMERLRRKILDHEFDDEGRHCRVTMSFGMVSMNENEGLDEAMRRADLMVYVAKQEGGNRVVVAGDGT